MPTRYY